MSLPRYADYKSSGIDWLGAVPAGWETWKLRRAFGTIGSGTTPPSDESHWYDEGTVPWVTTGELRESVISETSKRVTPAALQKFSTLKIHPKGSLAIAMYGATIGRLGLLGVDAATNQACCVLSGPRNLDVRFVFYWFLGFKQRIVDLYATGGGQPNINQETISSLRIPAPCLPEQTAIAAFLDRETAKIDALIAEQEKLIALLAEKRQATISHAVTRGLNPDAPMKDSGVAWLGEVPAHWVRTPIKHTLFAIIDTEHKTVPFYEDGKYLVARTSNIKNGKLLIDDAKYTDEQGYEEWTKRGLPEPGDILFTREAPAGEACIVPSDIPLCVGQRTVLMKVDKSKLNPRYGLWSIYGGLASEFVDLVSQGSTVTHFNMSDIGNIPLLLPSLDEQASIVGFVDSEIAKLDALTAEACRVVTLLKERRSALVAAAVTGQIDVRDA